MRKTILILLAGLILAAAALPALAQNEAARIANTETETQQVAPRKDAGAFAQGRKRVAFYGGVGSTYSQTYLILGLGFSYFVVDGLEVGVDGEGWLLQSPSIWKVSPQVRYTFWQAGNLKPYLGGFYRHTWQQSPWQDYDSWGGRAGVAYRQGGNYLAVGFVYERYIDPLGSDSESVYPEVSFWISF